ncbi:hypothetical protein PVAND_000945 [Polypedilum vanderplanki]|uniref:Uncharacterized protein n=1 Tax=Polypedilum vanderplanki TaxID=319348 RepID=A0A9J6BLQ3_POLVA|nr:hypothetical protein PVAND_000945 [Polypedilum vanderplanki]
MSQSKNNNEKKKYFFDANVNDNAKFNYDKVSYFNDKIPFAHVEKKVPYQPNVCPFVELKTTKETKAFDDYYAGYKVAMDAATSSSSSSSSSGQCTSKSSIYTESSWNPKNKYDDEMED